MTVSLPSKEIYAVDIPEVKDFTAEFQYNFFTVDESVSDTGGVPTKFLTRAADSIDSNFIQYATTRAPRFVKFTFSLPQLTEPGGGVTAVGQRNQIFSSNTQKGSLIADNIDKVVTEDHFATNNFIAVNFHDGEIDDKIYDYVSGSYSLLTMGQNVDQNVSRYMSAQQLQGLLPNYIKPHFLFQALSSTQNSSGTSFSKDAQLIFNAYFKKLKAVSANVQINSKLFYDITSRTIKDPSSQYSTDLQNLVNYASQVQAQAIQNTSLQVSAADFKTFVPFVDVKLRQASFQNDRLGSELVGYIIDKVELLPDGTIRNHPPFIIDDPNVNLTSDFQVKYGSLYVYSARTVALFTFPAIDNDTGVVAMIKVLISSKSSNKAYVQATEAVAPPAPTDLNFTWDYERVNPLTAQHDQTTGQPLPGTGRPGSLLIHWTFPPNSQRDIKKFQLFRRKSINHPFELIKMYDFDDSLKKYPNGENPDPGLVEYLKDPCSFFYDDDFQAGDHFFFDENNRDSNNASQGSHHPGSSTFIYAVAAVDAHGFTSNYSAQFEVWFDLFKNALQKKLISHTGAPKPYPNLYLEADAFVDTIRVQGPSSKQVRLYFNPEHYYLYDNDNKTIQILATNQTGGSYKLQFINLDNQKSAVVNVTLDNQLPATNTVSAIAFPEVRFGAPRLTLPRPILSL